ncbi:lytic transglycosylase domain-containing protein [Ciceribacter sp. RN22]|uniref:lytic transglycosylase domain-containing protein n=1 Tax=Ciceribacter sp. RN22 TaxID=2954932 RepID=UPI002093EE6C|nr:lytic transglycosylase domain-containing protein [Ciceribacter sp. RN22]MCO6180812.1 lytic transglycosylase domain-containing protein [Ciceribacter sp. RN22]
MLLIAGGVILAPAPAAMADPSVRVARPTRVAETVPSTDLWAGPIAEAAKRFDIPERWIRAVMAAESDSDPFAVSRKGAMGLMQIMPATWDELRGRYGLGEDAFDPRDNILAGAAYLAELYDLYGSPGFLAAYNAGPGRFERHLVSDEALPAETVAYVAKLLPMIESKAWSVLEAGAQWWRNTWSSAPLFFEGVDGSDRQQGHSQVGSAGLGENAGVARDLSGPSPAASGLFVRRNVTREGAR